MTPQSLLTLKARLIGELIVREAGYSNRSADRGGPTCWGITLDVARAHGYTGDMRALPRDFAARVYAGLYWSSLGLDTVAGLSVDLATYLFDFGVNAGPGRAAEYLQRELNVLNRRGKLYGDLVVDKSVGPRTLAALSAFADARGEAGLRYLASAINAERIVFCRGLAERDETQEENYFGWLSRVVELSSTPANSTPVPEHWLDELVA